MKKLFTVFLIIILLIGCDTEKNINGDIIPYYGLGNQQTQKQECYIYEVDFYNVAGGVIFFSTILAPVYVIGWRSMNL